MRAHNRFVSLCSTLALAWGTTPALASETQVYTYDVHGHLVAVQYSGTVNNGQAHSICYDPADNRVRYKSDSAGSVAPCISAPTPAPTGPPSFAVGDAYATEGGYLYFVVTKTGSTSSSFSVNYATANGTALAGSDYVAASGTLTFAASEAQKTILVSTLTGGGVEPDETMYLNLSAPTGGATLSDSQGLGIIWDGGTGGGGGGGGCQTC